MGAAEHQQSWTVCLHEVVELTVVALVWGDKELSGDATM